MARRSRGATISIRVHSLSGENRNCAFSARGTAQLKGRCEGLQDGGRPDRRAHLRLPTRRRTTCAETPADQRTERVPRDAERPAQGETLKVDAPSAAGGRDRYDKAMERLRRLAAAGTSVRRRFPGDPAVNSKCGRPAFIRLAKALDTLAHLIDHGLGGTHTQRPQSQGLRGGGSGPLLPTTGELVGATSLSVPG
jgi:hypothetical protein